MRRDGQAGLGASAASSGASCASSLAGVAGVQSAFGRARLLNGRAGVAACATPARACRALLRDNSAPGQGRGWANTQAGEGAVYKHVLLIFI